MDRKGNDDRILDCALYFGTSRACRSMVLTNDRNLALKAEGHGLATLAAMGSVPVASLVSQILQISATISDQFTMVPHSSSTPASRLASQLMGPRTGNPKPAPTTPRTACSVTPDRRPRV